jgi:hypothetical protein
LQNVRDIRMKNFGTSKVLSFHGPNFERLFFSDKVQSVIDSDTGLDPRASLPTTKDYSLFCQPIMSTSRHTTDVCVSGIPWLDFAVTHFDGCNGGPCGDNGMGSLRIRPSAKLAGLLLHI